MCAYRYLLLHTADPFGENPPASRTHPRPLLSTYHVEATCNHHAAGLSSPLQLRGVNTSLLWRVNCRRPRLCFNCRRRSKEAGLTVAGLGVRLSCLMSKPLNALRVQKAARHKQLSDTNYQGARNMRPARSSCIPCGWCRLVQVDIIGQWVWSPIPSPWFLAANSASRLGKPYSSPQWPTPRLREHHGVANSPTLDLPLGLFMTIHVGTGMAEPPTTLEVLSPPYHRISRKPIVRGVSFGVGAGDYHDGEAGSSIFPTRAR